MVFLIVVLHLPTPLIVIEANSEVSLSLHCFDVDVRTLEVPMYVEQH